MKKSITILLVALLSLPTFTIAFAQEKKCNETDHIEVSYTAQRKVTPDELYISITIAEKDNRGKISVEQQEREMMKKLEPLNLDLATNLQVDNMSSYMQQYILKKNVVMAAKAYTLKVATAEQMTKVFNILNNLKIANVNLEKSALSKALQQKVKRELLTEAAKGAKQNAEILASALGCKMYAPIYIQQFDNYYQPYVSYSRAMNSSAPMQSEDASKTLPSLNIQDINVSVNVLCKFRL